MSGTAETVNFDGAHPGFIPAGWSVTSSTDLKPGRWVVQADSSAPSRPYIFAQTSTHGGKQDYHVALFDKKTCKDADLSVDLKILSGKWEQSAGIVWRFQNTANYYFALASADKDSVGIYKKSNNVVSLLAHASASHRIDDKEWNLLKIVFRGPHFTLFFGHRKLVDATDATLTGAGKTGLWTKADTVAYFDNFRLDKRN
jgi:hypothetical protein